MVVKILAWDYSGSTSSMAHYHNHAGRYLTQYSSGVQSADELIYLKWNESCQKVTRTSLQGICKNKEGSGGTCPSTIVEWILTFMKTTDAEANCEFELWLITDGEIDSSELAKCARLNKDVRYTKINFIVINQRKINMSVGASFFSGTELQVFHDDQLVKKINTSKPFNYDAITLSTFDAKWDDLSDFIQAKFMGSDLDGLQEVDKLTTLRQRLLQEINGISTETKSSLRPEFLSKNKADILEVLKTCQFYKSLTTPFIKDLNYKIDSSISTLINYIHNKHKSFEFNSLKIEYKQSGMAEIPTVEPEPEIESLDNIEACNFYDAVTLENEKGAPILLLAMTDLIEKYWEKGNYSKFKTILACPLLAKIGGCIGHVYLIETFNTMYTHGGGDDLINPMTNERVAGGIIFSELADEWNDYVLSMTFFRGKKVPTNLAMWYYVIWKHAQAKAWVEADILEQLKKYAFRRLENVQVKLAFTNLPLDPKEVVSLPIACFYCTEGSSLLFGENPNLYIHEKLRMYSYAAMCMIEILEHFGYEDIDKKFIRERARTFAIMNQLKQVQSPTEKQYFLLEKIFQKTGNFLTYELKDKNSLKYQNLLNYHHKDTVIPFNYAENSIDIRPVVLVCYETNDSVKQNVQICPNTFRPYYTVEEEGQLVPYYKQLQKCIVKVELQADGELKNKTPVNKIDQHKVVSICKAYIDLTYIAKRFPTLEELTEYVHKRMRFTGSHRIRLFPLNMLAEIKEVFDWYSVLGPNVEDFLKKTQKSVSVQARVEMEDRLTGNKSDKLRFIEKGKALLKSV